MYMFVMSEQHMESEIPDRMQVAQPSGFFVQVCRWTPVQTDLKDDLQGGCTFELAYNCTLFLGIE